MATLFVPGIAWSREWRGIDDLPKRFAPGWGGACVRFPERDIRVAVQFLQTGRLQLARETWPAGLAAHCTCPAGAVVLGWVMGRPPVARLRGRMVSPGQLFIALPSDGFQLVALQGLVFFWLAVERDTLERHTQTLWGGELKPSQRLALNDADRLPRVWTQTLAMGLRHPGALTQPGTALALEDQLLEALLRSIVPGSDHGAGAPAQRHRALQRAVAYLEVHAGEPVTLTQLCRAVGSSARPLELAFRECFDLTPKSYLQLRRLCKARGDLRSLDPAATTVTEIATRWGFFHLGRFAQDYRRLFGESPRETLYRRSQPARSVTVVKAGPRPQPAA